MSIQSAEYYIDILEFLDQLSDVDEFYMRVCNLRDLILELDSSYKETYFVACFIQGLKLDLKEYVREACPETLLAAYELALCREGELQPDVEELDEGCRPKNGVMLDSVIVWDAAHLGVSYRSIDEALERGCAKNVETITAMPKPQGRSTPQCVIQYANNKDEQLHHIVCDSSTEPSTMCDSGLLCSAEFFLCSQGDEAAQRGATLLLTSKGEVRANEGVTAASIFFLIPYFYLPPFPEIPKTFVTARIPSVMSTESSLVMQGVVEASSRIFCYAATQMEDSATKLETSDFRLVIECLLDIRDKGGTSVHALQGFTFVHYLALHSEVWQCSYAMIIIRETAGTVGDGLQVFFFAAAESNISCAISPAMVLELGCYGLLVFYYAYFLASYSTVVLTLVGYKSVQVFNAYLIPFHINSKFDSEVGRIFVIFRVIQQLTYLAIVRSYSFRNWEHPMWSIFCFDPGIIAIFGHTTLHPTMLSELFVWRCLVSVLYVSAITWNITHLWNGCTFYCKGFDFGMERTICTRTSPLQYEEIRMEFIWLIAWLTYSTSIAMGHILSHSVQLSYRGSSRNTRLAHNSGNLVVLVVWLLQWYILAQILYLDLVYVWSSASFRISFVSMPPAGGISICNGVMLDISIQINTCYDSNHTGVGSSFTWVFIYLWIILFVLGIEWAVSMILPSQKRFSAPWIYHCITDIVHLRNWQIALYLLGVNDIITTIMGIVWITSSSWQFQLIGLCDGIWVYLSSSYTAYTPAIDSTLSCAYPQSVQVGISKEKSHLVHFTASAAFVPHILKDCLAQGHCTLALVLYVTCFNPGIPGFLRPAIQLFLVLFLWLLGSVSLIRVAERKYIFVGFTWHIAWLPMASGEIILMNISSSDCYRWSFSGSSMVFCMVCPSCATREGSCTE